MAQVDPAIIAKYLPAPAAAVKPVAPTPKMAPAPAAKKGPAVPVK
jgi:hypothetical protein